MVVWVLEISGVVGSPWRAGGGNTKESWSLVALYFNEGERSRKEISRFRRR